MKAVINVRLFDASGTHCVASYWLGTPSNLLAHDIDEARTFTNKGHAKNAISWLAKDVAWRIRHGTLGETGAKLARFFVVPVRLKMVQAEAPEEYTP